ncbi:MAG: class I SAM-dependent methyltransferase [Bacteroidia bacterium]
MENDNYIRGGRQKNSYEIDEVETCNCPLCGQNKFSKIYKERKSLEIVRCLNCDLIYVNPRVKEAETNYWGNAEIYFNEARLIFSGKKKHHRDKNYEDELRKIKSFKSSGKLLDIGCSMGFFLKKARDFGYTSLGVEPSPSLSKIAQEEFKLNVINAYLEKASIATKSIDIITMIDVFEHVTNPSELLSSAKEILSDKGIVCIKVPNGNYNSLKLKLARMSKREANHDIFDSYEHVAHYTKKTMKKMLEQNGFEIKKVFIPLPIHPPIWAKLVGHYYQYPSPTILDWKRVLFRNIFYVIGNVENSLGLKTSFAPDLLFIAVKKL